MKSHLPSEREALKLLNQAGCAQDVVNHCKAVADLAVEIAEACNRKSKKVDVRLVRIGALLHDIGRARTHTVDHGLLGAYLAEDLNLSPSVVSIIERHVGSGITSEEAEKLGWPVKDYVPDTLEEKIVAYADKLIAGSRRVTFAVALERFSQDRTTFEGSVRRLLCMHKDILCASTSEGSSR